MKSHGFDSRPILLLALASLMVGGAPRTAMAAEAVKTPEPAPVTSVASVSVGATDTSAGSPGSLRATSAVPWNPPGAASRRRGWERIVLFPGKLVTLPLSGLGYLTDNALGYVEANNMLARFSSVSRSLPKQLGISLAAAHLGSGSGIGATVGIRAPFLSGAWKSRVRAEHSTTLSHYHRTLVGFQGRPLLLQYGYDWRPEEHYYGAGLETSQDSASAFAAQSEFVRASLRFAWNADIEGSEPRTQVRLWGGPRTAVTRSGREAGTISFEQRFPGIAASMLDRRIDHLIYGGSFATDWRVGTQRWESGWRALVGAERYDSPIRFTALGSGRSLGAQFTRLTYESETGFSFMRDPRSVRILVRVMDQSMSSGRDRFLLSDLATLGGREGLAGFEPGRFRGMDLMVTKLSYVFPIVRRLELDLHSEWGGVYDNVWHDVRLGTLQNSYGVALRGRLKAGPLGSIGADFSREGARVRLSLGGVE